MGWTVWQKGPATALNLVLTGLATLLAISRGYRTLSSATLSGVLLTLVVLFTARWTTYAYFALVVPVVLLLPSLVFWEVQFRDGVTERP
jgi:hypothetical protein